ncbi:extensin-like [Sesamum indicum]|uniref:Extensin-like n=1 Tax=Sesamum indicum TaxID=4182 RepID=A0A6I9UMP5_SESIN|nr:extensin-like [Sesamum indicum]
MGWLFPLPRNTSKYVVKEKNTYLGMPRLPSAKMLPAAALLLLLHLLISQNGVGAAVCSAPSRLFHGVCILDSNCAKICEKEGYLSGNCKGLLMKCICIRDCGGEGDPPQGPPDTSPPDSPDTHHPQPPTIPSPCPPCVCRKPPSPPPPTGCPDPPFIIPLPNPPPTGCPHHPIFPIPIPPSGCPNSPVIPVPKPPTACPTPPIITNIPNPPSGCPNPP